MSAYQGAPITESVAEGHQRSVPVADKQLDAGAYRAGLKGGGGLKREHALGGHGRWRLGF